MAKPSKIAQEFAKSTGNPQPKFGTVQEVKKAVARPMPKMDSKNSTNC